MTHQRGSLRRVTPQERRDLGAALPCHRVGRQASREHHACRFSAGFSRKKRTPGVKWTSSACLSESTKPRAPVAFGSTLLRNTTSRPTSVRMLCARSRKTLQQSPNTLSAIISWPAGAVKSRRTSNRSTFSDGLSRLNTESKLAWTTIAKMRGVMSRIYKVGILHERVAKNPVLHVRDTVQDQLSGNCHLSGANACDPEITARRASPHAGSHLRCYGAPRRRSCWRCAGRTSGGMRAGFGCQSAGRMARTAIPRPNASDGYVPLHSVLAQHLHEWRSADALQEGHGLRVSFLEGRRPRSPLPFDIRC